MFKNLLITLLLIALCGCNKQVQQEVEFDPTTLFTGELNGETYLQIAKTLVTEANQAMFNRDLTEKQLKLHIQKVSSWMDLAESSHATPEQLYAPELMSVLGAMYSKQAVFHSTNAKAAGSYAAKGFRYLDRAISQYPNNVTARLNRGMVAANVPEFMNKTEVAKADLEFVQESEDFKHLPVNLQGSIKGVLQRLNARLTTDI